LNRFWSRLLRIELIIAGAAIMLLAVFAYSLGLDGAPDWGPTRMIAFGLGALVCVPGVVLSLPAANRPAQLERMEAAARHLHRVAGWCALALLGLELLLHLTGYTPVMWRVQTNWFGMVQASGTSSLLTDEGFAITHYRELGEVSSPYDSGENIIVLGDSRTEARQVPDNQKYVSVAETILRQRGQPVNLRNFGRSALAVADYVTHIPKYRALYSPRLFVVQLTLADLSGSFSRSRSNYFILTEGQQLQLEHKQDVSGPLKVSPNRIFNPNLLLVNYAVQRFDLLFEKNVADGEASTDLADAVIQQQIDMILQAAGDVPVIFVLIPMEPTISGGGLLQSKERFQHFVQLVRDTPGARVVDTLPAFQQLAREGHFPVGFFNSPDPDRGHLNRYGHQAVGELLAEAVEAAWK